MSSKDSKKKLVVTTGKTKKKIVPTTSKIHKKQAKTILNQNSQELIFGKQNYIWMLIGIAFITVGMLMMMGGHMPSRDVWDESIIYSPRRILIAPIFILIGLGIEIYAIFRNK